MTRRRRSRRVMLVGAATVLLLLATAVIVWRVLRPAEVVTPATAAYPSVVPPSRFGAVGALVSAPLILDDRIRVFAKKREIWADAQASYHYERSAYWAYRRWPAQVTGVVLVTAPRAVVVSAWSDGLLTGVDARTGTVVWRAQGDPLAPAYTGRRTGATTVYTPPGLLLSGEQLITVTGAQLRGFDPATGRPLWTIPSPVPDPCRGVTFSAAAQVLIHDTCTEQLRRLDPATGTPLPAVAASGVEPVSCAVGQSNCTGVRLTRAGTVSGWLLSAKDLSAAEPLHAAGSLAFGDTVVVPEPAAVSALAAATGQPRWRWTPAGPGPFRLLAANATHTLILGPGDTLVTLSSTTGRLLATTSLQLDHEPDRLFEIGHSYTSGRYLVIERLTPGIAATADDDTYFHTHRPVLLAYTAAN